MTQFDANLTEICKRPYPLAKRMMLHIFTAHYLKQALRAAGGNISHAAAASGMDRKTIHRLINKQERTS